MTVDWRGAGEYYRALKGVREKRRYINQIRSWWDAATISIHLDITEAEVRYHFKKYDDAIARISRIARSQELRADFPLCSSEEILCHLESDYLEFKRCFSKRICIVLMNECITTFGQLADQTSSYLLSRPNIGRRSIGQINRVLEDHGLYLLDDPRHPRHEDEHTPWKSWSDMSFSFAEGRLGYANA